MGIHLEVEAAGTLACGPFLWIHHSVRPIRVLGQVPARDSVGLDHVDLVLLSLGNAPPVLPRHLTHGTVEVVVHARNTNGIRS